MKHQFLWFFLLISNCIIGQTIITGTVFEKNNPLEGAAVYLNNTMVGTTTNAKGVFSLKVKEGKHELIISFLGYKTINYNLNTSTHKKPLSFTLVEEENTLNEIFIGKTKYDDEWKYNLNNFKREFIGQTTLAENCKILNPKALHFEFDAKNNILTAFARKPLQIKHKDLGYKITYDLESFIINKKYVTYLGYSRYENLKGSKRKQRKWKENRLKAYNGSSIHFYQSLLKGTSYEDGFIINLFKRVPNPERPSEEEIKKARELVKLNRTVINFSAKNEKPKSAIDSALLVLRKVRLPKFIDYLYESKAPINKIITKENGVYKLIFENNLSVVYTKELEEKGFILRNAFSKIRKALPQTSSIIPVKKPLHLDKNGLLINPLAVFYEGYWSYEKFANTLPLDYVPLK
ncbi:carboxypeptidase-like regulatory domain-containing protein [Polaribacter aestuariivivens]|uniref:carboxypeptidase-like regulatory domain-containing protein n=1 Tax=Polaribacter aestuariivivens TaxID=2304626 RepID=UPI003F495169